MDRRLDRRVAPAREAGYESTGDATVTPQAPLAASGSADGGDTSAQQDSLAEGGDGSHDGEGFATGEGCPDNPAAPMPSC
jgi:hypothetical protein